MQLIKMGSASLNIAIALSRLSTPKSKSSSEPKRRSFLSKMTRRKASTASATDAMAADASHGDDHETASQQTPMTCTCSVSSINTENNTECTCSQCEAHVNYHMQTQTCIQVMNDMEQFAQDMHDRHNGKDLINSRNLMPSRKSD
mmetsp:Transcript_22632/g.63127  ORF Transcript_22632/g.63127 Transcript_22632/m.63127 type:complete len:145 (-) Transcript_22632:404-838(-)